MRRGLTKIVTCVSRVKILTGASRIVFAVADKLEKKRGAEEKSEAPKRQVRRLKGKVRR